MPFAIYSAHYQSTKNVIMCQQWVNVWLLIIVAAVFDSLTEMRYRFFLSSPQSFQFYAFLSEKWKDTKSVYGIIKYFAAFYYSVSSVSINFINITSAFQFFAVDRFVKLGVGGDRRSFYERFPNVYKNVEITIETE